MKKLHEKKIAVLATNGFEPSELMQPKEKLADAGATVHVIAPDSGTIRGWNHETWTDPVQVDRTVDEVRVDEYDALVLPGGVINPDLLRTNDTAVRFTREFVESGKPVAAICHGPWMLVEADVLRGRTATSYHSIRTDLKNAGAKVEDEAVVVDDNLITSRKPDDLPRFIEKIATLVTERAPVAVR